jgi:hypothetical protein
MNLDRQRLQDDTHGHHAGFHSKPRILTGFRTSPSLPFRVRPTLLAEV